MPDGTQVFFVSPETGNIDSSCEIVSGECNVTWRSSGDRPKDLRATVLAYTPGAEDYLDTNGNNVYDIDDIFVIEDRDLGEPYVDENESNEYEPGELFVDTNKNRVRDDGNLVWDGPCLIAADPSADCRGEDSVNIWKARIITLPTNTVDLISSEINIDNSSTWVPTAREETISTAASTRIKLKLLIADDNEEVEKRIALPTGTIIRAFMDDEEFSVSGETNITIGSDQVHASVLTMTITDKDPFVDDPETALRVEVSVPGVNSVTYTWYIDD